MTLSMAFESSLDKCIKGFLQEVVIDKSQEYKCDKCKSIAKVKLKSELAKLPEILTFHLKRF
jgi:ubiquitin C-terminal hydrolase